MMNILKSPYSLMNKFHEYFDEFVQKANRADGWWLEMNGRPVPWGVPMAAIIDSLSSLDDVVRERVPYSMILHSR